MPSAGERLQRRSGRRAGRRVREAREVPGTGARYHLRSCNRKNVMLGSELLRYSIEKERETETVPRHTTHRYYCHYHYILLSLCDAAAAVDDGLARSGRH